MTSDSDRPGDADDVSSHDGDADAVFDPADETADDIVDETSGGESVGGEFVGGRPAAGDAVTRAFDDEWEGEDWNDDSDWDDADWDDSGNDPDDDTALGDDSVATGGDTGDARSRHRLLLLLTTVLIGAVAAGGVLLARGGFADHGSVGSTVIGEGNALVENDFTRSEPGDCLQWDYGQGADKQADEPSLTDCAKPHRFEVAGALDTETFPTSEFADAAPWPGPDRFATIRDENCPAIVDRYLGGGLDPQGRFSSGLMFPSKVQWEKGARVLRCGIEQPGTGGVQEQFAGRVADIDQSFTWPVGTCIGIDEQTRKATSDVVDCSEPHAFQTTGVVDLTQRFGDRHSGKAWPSVRDQNTYLTKICPTETNKFFGGASKFKDTTLNVQWSVISEVSWLTGSRRVVCYAALPNRGGFATLVGDAREQVLINGRVPVPPEQGPPGRSVGTPVPLPPGYNPDSREIPAPSAG